MTAPVRVEWTPEQFAKLLAEAEERSYLRGAHDGSSSGWWDATVRAEMHIDQLEVHNAQEAFIEGARSVLADLRSTEHTSAGYRDFLTRVADVARQDGVREGRRQAVAALRATADNSASVWELIRPTIPGAIADGYQHRLTARALRLAADYLEAK